MIVPENYASEIALHCASEYIDAVGKYSMLKEKISKFIR